MAPLHGTPSDDLPEVLATGATDVRVLFVSMSAREPDGRDEEYLEWHSLDHRPEQYRLDGVRHSLRLVSTPACRAARAVTDSRYDAVDHVMTYFFADANVLDRFTALSAALGGDRRPLRLPTVEFGVYDVAGRVAAPRALAGADVIPWRPARGVFLVVEQGARSPAALAEVPGVAGIWWHHTSTVASPVATDNEGMQVTYCYLDDDPVDVAVRLRAPLDARWKEIDVEPLLAAPFYTPVPFEWGRYLP
jgi:hypothetical protein